MTNQSLSHKVISIAPQETQNLSGDIHFKIKIQLPFDPSHDGAYSKITLQFGTRQFMQV